jgi:hypothetical protein
MRLIGVLCFGFFERRVRRGIVEYGFGMLLSFNNVIIIIMNTYFPEPPLVLASMIYHFEPDNDSATGCMLKHPARHFTETKKMAGL